MAFSNGMDRIKLLTKLGEYMGSGDAGWAEIKLRAVQNNAWFTEEYIDISVKNIVEGFLQEDKLTAWLAQYTLPQTAKTVGIVMAGNIPLVGFHDFLCGFVSGHRLMLKLSSKDDVLLKHIIQKMTEWHPAVAEQIVVSDMLKGCDAYIATGSNNSSRYFEQYFAKYPHIIRRNRTSVAVLTGIETTEELQALAKDVFTYFGLGCRNVTQVCVPHGYNFVPMLEVFGNHGDMKMHHKYNNNYDYHLALYLLNRVAYLTNDSLLMVENDLPFSAVSVLHYRYYDNRAELITTLKTNDDIQCIVAEGEVPFGQAQVPSLNDYADGIDTMEFLCAL